MDPIGRQILLQLVLILLNAFFAAAEIAVISLNPGKLKKLVENGDKKASKLLTIIDRPAGFLSTIQIGITFTGFISSAFAAKNFSGKLVAWFVNIGFTSVSEETLSIVSMVIVTIILSYITLLFGELIPKRIAMQKAMQIAKISSGVICAASVCIKPVSWLLTASANLVLKILRLETESEDDAVTEEEIRFMVDVGEENGAINPEEKEMIENIFEFNNTTAKDVMTHYKDVELIQSDMSDDEIFEIISSTGYSRFPVYEDDINDIIGIIIAKEFLLHRVSDDNVPLSHLLRPPYFVPESVHTDVLFRDMQSKKQHFSVVVNEYGETRGIVTMEDLLEEIVGNIYDESDMQEDEPEITKLSDNLWRMSGSVSIDTLAEELDLDDDEFDEDRKFDTLGGLVFSQLQTIPEDGSKIDVEVGSLEIHVEEFEDRRVVTATVCKKLKVV